jgi:hypothetical protein
MRPRPMPACTIAIVLRAHRGGGVRGEGGASELINPGLRSCVRGVG